jgi:acyl carrier protein
MHVQPATFARAVEALGHPGWLSQMRTGVVEKQAGPLIEAIRAAGPELGRIRLREYLTQAASRTLDARSDSLDLDQPLQEMGLDSMMAVELRNELQRAFGVEIPATILFDYPTINKLTAHLEVRMRLWEETAELSALSDAQVAELLAQELSSLARLDSK